MTVLHDYTATVTQPTLVDEPVRYDELVDVHGTLREGWRPLAERVVSLTDGDLRRVGREIDRFLANDGVTYSRDGSTRRWRLDPLPLVVSAQEWAPLEVALAQRAELLNAILVDLYGPQRLLAEGILPPAVVFGHSGFLRVAARSSHQEARPLLMAAADLGRTASGEWQVLADRAQAPSGIGYAMENRRVISRVLPELYRAAGLHRVAPYFQALRTTLVDAAPGHLANPRVVVLSPGTHSETAYDQAFIASSLGFPLVQGSDLTVRDGAVWMRALGRLERVDVIVRRVDAAWSDPLELRGDSQLGVAGLTEAVRRGHVTVVNGLGAGVLENPALLPFMARMSEFLLDEPLRLPSVQTYWCGDDRSRAHVLAHLDELNVRTIDRPTQATDEPRDGLVDRIVAQPWRYVGQERAALSQTPTLSPAGVVPSGVILRTFTIGYGSGYRPLAGGLATAFDTRGGVRQSISKDVWVLKAAASDPDQGLSEVVPMTNVRAPAATVPRVLEDLFWLGRYAERSESMLRLLLTAHGLADDYRTRPYSSGGVALAVMLAATQRLSPSEPLDAAGPDAIDDDLRSLLLDSHRPGSVAQSLASLRDAAQGVRDQLSEDMWRALGAADRASAQLREAPHSHQIAESATSMLMAMLGVSGVIANMMRDVGWQLLGVGRDVERSLQLCFLLRDTLCTRRGIDADRDTASALLATTESAVTHRRRYRGYLRAGNVLELMLLDADNPRSLRFALVSARQHLAAVPGASDTSRPQRMLDDLLEELDRADLAALVAISGEDRPNLERFLDGIVAQLGRLADAIADAHFAAAPAPRAYGLPQRVG